MPVAFVNPVCQKDDGNTILKPNIDSFASELVLEGPKAESMLAKAGEFSAATASNVTVVTELLAFQPKQETDYFFQGSNLDCLPTSLFWHAKMIQKPRASLPAVLRSTRPFCFTSIMLASWSRKVQKASSPTALTGSWPTCV